MRCYLAVHLILITFALDTHAQKITGRVVDGESGQSLHFAHVFSADTGEGTVTDEDGRFTLITNDIRLVRTLMASHVGFESQTQIVTNQELIFKLVQGTSTLKEVEVVAPNALKIIRSAIDKIPENHGNPRLLECFVRKYAKNKEKFIQISEASYQWNQHAAHYNQLKVLKARSIEDEKAFNGVGMHIGTPAEAVRNLDFTMEIDESFFGRKKP